MKPKLRFKEFDEDWEEKKLGEILTVNSGKDYKHLHRGDIPVYGTGGIIAHVNQFLSSKDGIGIGRKGTIDKPIYLKAPYWTVDTLFYCLTKFSNEFVFNICQRINWKKYDESTGVPSLSKQNIEKIKVYIPLISEQEKIGQFFSLLDDRIEKQEQKINLLKERKKGWMQKLFNQEIRFKDEDGNDYPDWEEKKLENLLEAKVDNRGKTPQNQTAVTNHPLLEVNSIGDLHVNYAVVNKYVTEEVYDSQFRKHIQKGDILFSTVGNTALCSYYDEEKKSCIAQNIVGFRFYDDNCSKFMFYMLSFFDNYKKMKAIEMGAVQPSIKVSQLVKLSFLIPSLPEQEKIGDFLSKQDELIEQEEKKIELLKEQKKGLLQQMFV